MLAIPRSTVRPRLSIEAQSSATAAFLEERTSISPASSVGPVISKLTVPSVAASIKGISSADASLSIMLRETFCWPISIR